MEYKFECNKKTKIITAVVVILIILIITVIYLIKKNDKPPKPHSSLKKGLYIPSWTAYRNGSGKYPSDYSWGKKNVSFNLPLE